MSRKNIVITLILIIAYSTVHGQDKVKSLQKNAIYHNKKGWEYLESGITYSAIISFQNALAQNKNYKEALLGLGYAYIKTEGYYESIKLFENVLKFYPNNEQALMGMAKAYTGLGKYNKAMQLYDTLNRLSYDNNDSRYGMAYLYYKMGKMLWAKRLLTRILQNDPYYYDALLLMADIKARDNRLDDAIDYAKKAINAKEAYPDGFAKLAELLYLKYLHSNDNAFLSQAIDELQKSLIINKMHLTANRDMGFLMYIQGDYQNAIKYYETIDQHFPYIANSEILYNLALSYEKKGDVLKALQFYNKALSKDTLNSLIAMKVRQLCILEHIKIGHPLRVQSSNDDYIASQKLRKKGFPDLSMFFVRLAAALNPNNTKTRQELLRIYETLGYFELYFDEMQKMHTMNPTQKSHDMTSLAVIKRRDKLFYKLGFDKEELQRDVPLVLTLDFMPDVAVPAYADAGNVIANTVNFAMGQFGRYRNFPMAMRQSIVKGFESKNFDEILKTLNEAIANQQMPEVSYLLYGEYSLSERYIQINAKFMDAKTGVIITQYNVSDNSKYSLQRISIDLAQQVYNTIPYWGTILSYNDDMLVVNLGRIDGLEVGNLLECFVDDESAIDPQKMRKKVILEIKEIDTHVLLAQPVNPKDIDIISKGLHVYPVQKRRAKMLKNS